jgi:gluconate 2-dehydrogenase gamma chain
MSNDERDAAARRTFLKQAAAMAGAAAVVGAVITPSESRAADLTEAAPFAGYEFFGPDDAAFVEALVNVMCPADQFTPNGVDCGLATFFDRQLAGPFGQGKGRYMRGPWNPGPPEMGLQLPLTPAQFFKVGLSAANEASVRRFTKPFAQLSATAADAFLHDVQDGHLNTAGVSLDSWFNALVYPLFVQACFSDPLYGGNYNKVFWKMLGYPGLPATHALDMVQYRGKPYPAAANPKSMLDFG